MDDNTAAQRRGAPADAKSGLNAQEMDEELPTLLDPSTCTRKGLCPVTHIRGQDDDPLESHSLYYEIHGSGPERVVLIMGLNGSFLSWMRQVEYLSRTGKHQVLVFDNRGAGNSGTPHGPYTTSAMAMDVIALLDYLGWSEQRGIHMVGISLGGMIAQEVAWRIPERLASLMLAVTTPGGPFWTNFPPWVGFITLARLLFITDRDKKVPIAIGMLFSKEWLDAPAEGDDRGRTNRQVQEADLSWRMTAIRVQQPIGALSQMWAGMTHHVSAKRLEKIAKGVPKIVLATGDDDHLVSPSNSHYLAKHMPGSELVVWEKTGHAVQLQRVKEFSELIERCVDEGRQKAGPPVA
ncbi:alpha/beta-hydrolase [Peniophora sp. CONT]|nr:alpha/beta-hydrolase [Peniophora sp. CONT]